MVEVIWTDQAIDDINNIAEFISKDSFKYAQIQVSKFFVLALLLEKIRKLDDVFLKLTTIQSVK